MSLLSSGGPDGYCQSTRFCSCSRRLARGSKAGVRANTGWFTRLYDNLRHSGDNLRQRSGGFPFSPLNAGAVDNKKLVADRYSSHVEAFVDQPERMSGLQGLLDLWPDGAKLSHQLTRLFARERFDGGQQVFIRRSCVPHTDNASETVFLTEHFKRLQKAAEGSSLRPVLTSIGSGRQPEVAIGSKVHHRGRSFEAHNGQSISASIKSKNHRKGT